MRYHLRTLGIYILILCARSMAILRFHAQPLRCPSLLDTSSLHPLQYLCLFLSHLHDFRGARCHCLRQRWRGGSRTRCLLGGENQLCIMIESSLHHPLYRARDPEPPRASQSVKYSPSTARIEAIQPKIMVPMSPGLH